MEFERYMEKVQITSWRNGCVFTTSSLGCGWFSCTEIDGNQPGHTGFMYVPASGDFARNNMTMRRKQ